MVVAEALPECGEVFVCVPHGGRSSFLACTSRGHQRSLRWSRIWSGMTLRYYVSQCFIMLCTVLKLLVSNIKIVILLVSNITCEYSIVILLVVLLVSNITREYTIVILLVGNITHGYT